ncbi:hypothetical protein Pcinc_020632 [Petrolisthes cinctipes]|uniref:Cytochrome P450 n=1 Tax=Petrolisthes cinctipes TaxID=88211 RepID=A0AAE1FJV9_PETCI|nr:hypothetical protein Pcinc_020632 [Petrolisthes cinctipes]
MKVPPSLNEATFIVAEYKAQILRVPELPLPFSTVKVLEQRMWVEALLLVLLFLLLKKVWSKPDGLPPGRWGLPYIGSIPFFSKLTLYEHLKDLQKKHGDIYTWRMGTEVIVFIHDYKLTKEILNRPEVSDRPDWIFFTLGDKPPLGIGSTNGELWHNNRRFSLRQLRDLGMGKSKLVAAVHNQATILVEELKKQSGQPAPVPHAVNVAVINIIWQMVASIQFEVTDPKMIEFQDLMTNFNKVTDRAYFHDLFSWLPQILPSALSDRLFKLDHVRNLLSMLSVYFKKVIDEHRATLDMDNPRDLIDNYLIDLEGDEKLPVEMQNEKNLVWIILDLFFAGSQTTADTLRFTFYYLANNPRVQSKLHAELDEVLGGALATLEDKARLPYTDGVINEALRMSSLTPIGIHHLVRTDIQLAGYTIPKGTVINNVTQSIHTDTRYWKDPHQFLPERWLDDKGCFSTKKEGFLPFSVGKRQCVGEGLARMELMIFLAAVMANFTITPPPGKTIDSSPDPVSPTFHITRVQDIVFTMRK